MGAYGFNEDKSKAPFVKELLITPNTGEQWKDYIPRVWNAINSIGKGHILSIGYRLGGAETASELTFMLPDKYYAEYNDGGLPSRTTITAIRNDFSNDIISSIQFWTMTLSNSANGVTPKVCQNIKVTIYDTTVVENYYSKTDVVESYNTFRIFYIP